MFLYFFICLLVLLFSIDLAYNFFHPQTAQNAIVDVGVGVTKSCFGV